MSSRYQQKTAIDCMVENVPAVSSKTTVADVLALLHQHARDFASISYVYLVDGNRTLVGVVSIRDIFVYSAQTIIAVAAKKSLVSVSGDVSMERVALTAIDHNLKAVPVIDKVSNRLLGVVTSETIRDVLHYGRIHDLLQLSGAGPFDDPKSSLLSGSPFLHIRKRLPWLLLGLLGGFVAALIVQSFETALAAHVLIIAFIPLVVYLADAVGSQTEIIFVRALALDPSLRSVGRFKAYLARECVVSVSLALLLGLCMSVVTTWWFQTPELVPVIFTAIIVTLVAAMLVALFIPFVATRLRYDPALTSGPVATVVRDVLTLVLYFYIVALFL